MEKNILEKAELFATGIIANEFSDRLIFHDIGHQYRVIEAIQTIALSEEFTEEQMEIVLLGGWFSSLGLKKLEKFVNLRKVNDFFESCNKLSIEIAKRFLEENNYEDDKLNKVLQLLAEVSPNNQNPLNPMAKVLSDGMYIDYGGSKSKIKKQYEELLLAHVASISKGEYYDIVINLLIEHKYQTDFALKDLRPHKEALIAKLIKEQKDVKKTEDEVLKTELGIEDDELKRLKRNLKSVQGRDDRGIQTMFRTTSRNHYTLLEMVDRKANIMISVNAIILSIIIGNFIANDLVFSVHNLPILIIILITPASIFFAVSAIRPEKTHGAFTEAEVRSKKGNLLYFGNYHGMSLKDYEWGVLQMLNDKDFLYSSMIKDLYFLGLTLDKKYRLIRKSLFVFTLGVLSAVIIFLVITSMGEMHLIGK